MNSITSNNQLINEKKFRFFNLSSKKNNIKDETSHNINKISLSLHILCNTINIISSTTITIFVIFSIIIFIIIIFIILLTLYGHQHHCDIVSTQPPHCLVRHPVNNENNNTNNENNNTNNENNNTNNENNNTNNENNNTNNENNNTNNENNNKNKKNNH